MSLGLSLFTRSLGCALFALGAVLGPAAAGTASAPGSESLPSEPGTDQQGKDEEPSDGVEVGRTLLLFPHTKLFKPYIADPHRAGFGFVWMHFDEATIADSSSVRIALRVGGRLGFLRIHPAGKDRRWQISAEVGLDGQFDRHYSLDSIGWDGNYGLMLTTVGRHRLALKLGVLHTSSHVGDEYAERTGRKRLGYTREEFVFALSWDMSDRWRTYAEGGWAYILRNETVQDPGRSQFGLEYENAKSLWKKRLGWYAALDLSAMEERDWRLDRSFQVGLVLYEGTTAWRLGLELYDGRAPMGEFYQDTESYLGFGLWMDL